MFRLPRQFIHLSDACYAFTVVSTIAAAVGGVVGCHGSEQELFDWLPIVFQPTCSVTYPIPEQGLPNNLPNAFEYVRRIGLCFERDYKWVGSYQQHPPTNLPLDQEKIFIADYKNIDHKNHKLVVEQLKMQPLAGAIKILSSFENWGFEDKIYEGPSNEEIEEARRQGQGWVDLAPNHAVTLVGYGGVEGVNDYYLCQNSYGTDWGHYGYFKVRRSAVFSIWYPIKVYKAKRNPNGGQTSHQDSADVTDSIRINRTLNDDPMDVDVVEPDDSDVMEIDHASNDAMMDIDAAESENSDDMDID